MFLNNASPTRMCNFMIHFIFEQPALSFLILSYVSIHCHAGNFTNGVGGPPLTGYSKKEKHETKEDDDAQFDMDNILGQNSELDALKKKYPELETPLQIVPSEDAHTATIIFLHDYGQTGEWWTVPMEHVREEYMKIVCPTACIMPIYWQEHRGIHLRSWFNFDGDDLPKVIEKDPKGITEVVDFIHYLIDDEIANEIPANRIILAGISQGATLALHAGLSYRKKIAGIVALTPWFPLEKLLKKNFNPANKDVPILQTHVENNPHVTEEQNNATAQMLKKDISRRIIYKKYSEEDHSVNMEYDDMKEFCFHYVPGEHEQ